MLGPLIRPKQNNNNVRFIPNRYYQIHIQNLHKTSQPIPAPTPEKSLVVIIEVIITVI